MISLGMRKINLSGITSANGRRSCVFIVMFLLCKHVRLTCVLNKLMMMMMMMMMMIRDQSRYTCTGRAATTFRKFWARSALGRGQNRGSHQSSGTGFLSGKRDDSDQPTAQGLHCIVVLFFCHFIVLLVFL